MTPPLPSTATALPARARFATNPAWFAGRCPVIPAAAPAPLSELLHVLGVGDRAPASETAPTIPVWRVRAGAVLLREGAPCEFVHVVRSGSFKSLRTSEDGYEHVLGFAGAGEVLGFEGLYRGRHPSSLVALEDSTAYGLSLRELDRLRQRSPALDQALQLALSRQLARSGEVAEMMAAVAAEVRLARFLVWWSGCMAERGQSPHRLYLRMSRRDIASLLGVAHETVSRSFSALAEWGYLHVENRAIEILDPEGLRRCSRNTRGLTEEAPRGKLAPGSHRVAAPPQRALAA